MAGERLGSAVAVRSTAPRVSGAPSFGSFESVRFSNPNIGSILIRGGDSQAPSPSFRFEPLRPRQLNALKAQNTQPVQQPEVAVPQPVKPSVNSENQPTFKSSPNVEIVPVVHTQARGRILFFPAIIPLELKPVPSAKPETAKVAEEASNNSILEQQVLLSQIRRSLMRTRSLLRVNSNVSIMNEPIVTPAVQTLTDSSPAVSESRPKQTEVPVKTLSQPKEIVSVQIRRASSSLGRGQRQVINIESEKAVVDEATNKLRIDSLIASRDRLKALGQFDRQAVINVSGIAYMEVFKSSIVGKRWDGTLPRTGKDILKGNGELTNEKIFEDVTRHPALKRSKEGVLASQEQLYEVITHPEIPYAISEEEILPIKKEVKIVETGEPVVRNQLIEPVVESKTAESNRWDEVRIQPAVDINQNIQDIVQFVVDRGVYSIDLLKRKELVEELAA